VAAADSGARSHPHCDAPDLPGHGESGPPAGDYSLGAHACAMRDLLLAARDARPGEVMAAHRTIDMAIGVLRELRGCSEREAVRELNLAGRETGLGTQRIARALVNVFADENGRVTDPDRVAAVNRWRPLLDARAGWKPTSQDDPAAANNITIRYGGVNDHIRC
jgi:hypothetical protein